MAKHDAWREKKVPAGAVYDMLVQLSSENRHNRQVSTAFLLMAEEIRKAFERHSVD